MPHGLFLPYIELQVPTTSTVVLSAPARSKYLVPWCFHALCSYTQHSPPQKPIHFTVSLSSFETQHERVELNFLCRVTHFLLCPSTFILPLFSLYHKASAYNGGDPDSTPGLGRSPGEGNGNPLQVTLPGKSHGPRSLVGYSPWGRKESDTTEQLHFHFSLLSSGPPWWCRH